MKNRHQTTIAPSSVYSQDWLFLQIDVFGAIETRRGLAYFEQVDGKLVERTGGANPFMNASWQ